MPGRDTTEKDGLAKWAIAVIVAASLALRESILCCTSAS